MIEGSAVQDNSYNIEESNSLGKVQIADDVVAIIAGLAAGEVEGVYRLTGNLPNELASKFGKKNPAKGVKVMRVNEGEKLATISVVDRFEEDEVDAENEEIESEEAEPAEE